MRRITALLPMLMLTCVLAFGQARVVTGRVTDEKGDPIPFATITEAGTKNATSADANGLFSIKIPENARLVVSSSGFQSITQAVSGNTAMFALKKSEESLTEVTVTTALGIRRTKNSLTYAAQQVAGDEVSKSRSNNFISSMSGKVSGMEIRQGNGLGASTNVVIRGAKSLTGNNQALFVVDGVPVDNSNTSTESAATKGNSNQMTGRGGYDYGNAAADINPDDIESINVLKGAAATALYGSRATNGVVMITTKKGKKGLGITVNSGVTIGSMDKSTYAKYQKEYGAGYGDGYSTVAEGSPDTRFRWKPNPWGTGNILVVPTTEDASYGAKFDPNLMVYQWDAFVPTSPNYKKATPWVGAENDPTSFFENSFSINNSIMLDGANDKGNFKLGYTRNEEKGLLPNSKILKNIINFGASYNLTTKLTTSTSVNFSKVEGLGRYGTGYNDWNPNQQFRQWWQTNVDVKALKDAYFNTLPGQPRKNMTWNWRSPTSSGGLTPIYSDNPYWTRYENYEQDSRYRVFGNTNLNFNPIEGLNILGRISLDSYDEQQEERNAIGSNDPGSYSKFLRTYRELNYDLMANYERKLSKDFNLKALLGTNLRRTSITSTYAATNGGLFIPKVYALNNTINPITPTETYEPTAVDGYFAGATLGYRDFATVDVTGRRDRSSTLPENNNAYNYYSISGGFVFSKLLTQFSWLSYGKLRASYAEVGNSPRWGSTGDVYTKPAPFGTAIIFALPITKGNTLKPERTKSQEIGLEMSFLRNRIGFDVSYYNTKSVDQIVNTPVTAASGYTAKWVNAGAIQNKGVELSLNGTPVMNRNFSWDIKVNWSQNRNKVLELFGGSTNLVLASFQQGITINATLGQPYGTIQGKTWETLNGQKLIDERATIEGEENPSYGRYLFTNSSTNVIGNVNPDWLAGISNTVRYKNFSFGFLIDIRKGGDVFSLDLAYGYDSGMYEETVRKNDKGNDSRLPRSEGGGIIVPGVTADGKANTIRVENINGTYGYQFNPNAAFVFDASYVKLREMNLTYSLPTTVVKKMAPFKGIDFSLVGRNLWIIHKNLPYADPEENLTSGNAQGYQSGAYPTARTMGLNIKLKF